MTTTEKRELLIAFEKFCDGNPKITHSTIYPQDIAAFLSTLPDGGENVGSKIVVGSKVKVCGRLITIITRVENDKYYFKDEEGREWQENIGALKLI